jgi:hypothetical protein
MVASMWALVSAAAAQQVPVPGAVAPESPPPEVRPDPSFQAGPVKITPGGFLELTGIYRHRNETADLGSSFNSIPYPDNVNYYISEFRMTPRNSRFSLLAQAPADRFGDVSGYVETDFLGVGTNSNSVESNS